VLGSECYLAEPNPEWKCDVLFTGSYGYHKEWAYRPLLIDKLRERYGARFKLIEHESPGAPWRGSKLNQLYASAKVVVGDSCNVNPLFHHEKYWSDRAPEVLGRANALLVHPYVRGMDSFYEDGKHLVYYQYNDWDDLFGKIDYYVLHDKERQRIGNCGHEFVKSSQTYKHRMDNVLNVVLRGKPNVY
jgi:hypothetical protein